MRIVLRYGVVGVIALSSAACAPECPASAGSCPDGCREVAGIRWDEEASCWSYETEVVGCEEEDDLVEAIGTCVVRESDGAVFEISGLPPESPDFHLCGSGDQSEECAACTADNRELICGP